MAPIKNTGSSILTGYGSGRKMGPKETLKSLAHKAFSVLPPIIAVLMVAAGYYFIWSISPDSQLSEVMYRTRSGIVLTLTGGLILFVCMHSIFR